MSIHAVIVSYNPDIAAFTKVIESLSAQVRAVTIVDNASKNGDEVERLAQAHQLQLIRFTENKGIAAAQNAGIAAAKAAAAGYVLLMDQDTTLPSGAVSNLSQHCQTLEAQGIKIGAIGCAYRDTHDGKLNAIWRADGLFLHRQNFKLEDTTIVEADCVIASGSLIPVSTLEAVGDMEADLFIDLVDIEWGLRAKSQGYRNFISFSQVMAHTLGNGRISIFGKTISLHSPIRNYYSIRNSILLSQRRYIDIAWRFYFIRRVLPYFIVFGLFGNQKKTRLKLMLRGMVDSFTARKGPYTA